MTIALTVFAVLLVGLMSAALYAIWIDRKELGSLLQEKEHDQVAREAEGARLVRDVEAERRHLESLSEADRARFSELLRAGVVPGGEFDEWVRREFAGETNNPPAPRILPPRAKSGT